MLGIERTSESSWSWWLWTSNSQHWAHSPLRSRTVGLGFPDNGHQGLWQLLPLFNLAMIKWSPGEVALMAQGYSISWKQSEDLSSAQRATEFNWSTLLPSLGTPDCPHTLLGLYQQQEAHCLHQTWMTPTMTNSSLLWSQTHFPITFIQRFFYP